MENKNPSKNPGCSKTETDSNEQKQKLEEITRLLKKTLNIKTEKDAQNDQVDCLSVRSMTDDSDEKVPGPGHLFPLTQLKPLVLEGKMGKEQANLLHSNCSDADGQLPETSPIPMSSYQDQQFGPIRLQSLNFMKSIKTVEAETSSNTVVPISTFTSASSIMTQMSPDILGAGFLFAEKEFNYIEKLKIQGFIDYTLDCENNRILVNLQSSSRSPYYNRELLVELQIDPDNYPKKPLVVKFLSNVYHPFVEINTGLVGLRDLDLYPERWEINGSITYICLSILRMLDNPRWEGGRVLNNDAHKVLRKDPEKLFQMAKSYGVSK